MPDDAPERELITAGMLAKLADVSLATVLKLIQSGVLVPVKHDKHGYPMLDPEDPKVAAWLKAVRGG
jgi:hypothetical protein